MKLSRIGQSLGESVTLKLNATAAAMLKAGEPVIHLGGGEPKSKAPLSVIADVNEILQTREVRYSPAAGLPEMRDAVIKYTKEYYNIDIERKNTCVSSGAKQSLSAALQALVDPGDEVVFPAPYWVSYPDIVNICGGKSVAVHAEDGGLYPTFEDMKSAINGKTKVVILNSPNNPSGVVYSEEFIKSMVEFCEKSDIFLIMDDIYHRLIFDNYERVSCYKFTTKKINESNIIVINGVSKQYAMTGFRIGWAVANPAIIEAISNIQAHLTSGPNVLMQKAAIGAINGPQEGVTELAHQLELNRNVLVEEINKIPNVKLSMPRGTFYSFVDFSAYEKDSVKLALDILEKVKVVTVPGVSFGMDGYLRISYCNSEKDIREGIQRIKKALEE
ncbi:MAG: pyridoxal phosphate-dependent aminotransferase [bacterium]